MVLLKQSLIKILGIFLVFSLMITSNFAWSFCVFSCKSIIRPLVKNVNIKTISDDTIKMISEIKTSGGIKLILDKLDKTKIRNGKIPKARIDAYFRIAINKKILSRQEAESMMFNIHNTKGLNSTLSKIVGNSTAKTQGHLHELRMANIAKTHRFQVLEIGKKFSDPTKKNLTDIDLLIKKNNQLIAVEAKNYAYGTNLKMDAIRADMDTLVQYKKQNSVAIIVFSLRYKPHNLQFIKLQKEAKKRNIEIIIGNVDEQIIQLGHLSQIL